ncbi:hypothetical protein KUTeg_024734 [Tegillarca granosa]|uniref:Fibroblast growth factor n=1 Tax=Tegillarca granosa TaxID=220873 RepID=A0ABQ9DY94_TEGGR|nr:hypothetical protein KUTeg_024734 [Tegillarca granosa]
MTTNVIQKTGVARLSILIILIFVAFHKGHCRPAASNFPMNMEPHSKTNLKTYATKAPEEAKLPNYKLPWNKATKKPHAVQGQKFFLSTKNSSWFEVLENGTIRGNTCRTKYGLLESRSHESTTVLKGIASNRYICLSEKGVLYTDTTFNPIDCAFLEKARFENNKTVKYITYGHHKHNRSDGKSKSQRYHFGINCNGKVVVTKEGLSDKEPDDFPETCEKSKCPSENPNSSGSVNPNARPKAQAYSRYFRWKGTTLPLRKRKRGAMGGEKNDITFELESVYML